MARKAFPSRPGVYDDEDAFDNVAALLVLYNAVDAADTSRERDWMDRAHQGLFSMTSDENPFRPPPRSAINRRQVRSDYASATSFSLWTIFVAPFQVLQTVILVLTRPYSEIRGYYWTPLVSCFVTASVVIGASMVAGKRFRLNSGLLLTQWVNVVAWMAMVGTVAGMANFVTPSYTIQSVEYALFAGLCAGNGLLAALAALACSVRAERNRVTTGEYEE